MKHAICELERSAQVAEHNLPYSEAAGDTDQAELQRSVATECRQAIEQMQEETPATAG